VAFLASLTRAHSLNLRASSYDQDSINSHPIKVVDCGNGEEVLRCAAGAERSERHGASREEGHSAGRRRPMLYASAGQFAPQPQYVQAINSNEGPCAHECGMCMSVGMHYHDLMSGTFDV